jgi:polar amino acid transport system substrate-binding protein
VNRSTTALAAVTAAVCAVLAACGSGTSGPADTPPGTVLLGAVSNGAATRESTLTVTPVPAIRAELPAAIRDGGELHIGQSSLPAGTPPLGFVGSDQQTLTGSEPDLARLVAAVFGLKPVLENATWENMFVGLDSGRTQVAFSNITDTEARKQKYDFACYRKDNVAFLAPASSTWTFTGDPGQLAGKTVAVDKGTNQERLLLEWQRQLRATGRDVTVKYFPDSSGAYLALSSGKLDAYLAPNPSVAYHITQTAHTPQPTRNAGAWSGAGGSLQGLICATSKKDAGLAKPLADAVDYLIQHGQYATWLATWNLANEAVPSSQINPPGLPVTDS